MPRFVMSNLDSIVTYIEKSPTTNVPQSIGKEGESAAVNAGTFCTDDATFWAYFGMIIIAFVILTFQLCATYLSVKCIINVKQVEKGIKVACLRRQRPGYNCPVKNCLLSYLYLMKKNGHLISGGKQAKGGSYRENDSQKKAALKAALSNALSPAGRCWQNRELLFADMCTYFSLYNFVESPHAGFKSKTRFKNDEERRADRSARTAAEKFDPKGSGIYENCNTAKSKASKRMTQPADSVVNDDSRADGPADKSTAGGAVLADLTSGSARHKKAIGGAKTENKQVKKSKNKR